MKDAGRSLDLDAIGEVVGTQLDGEASRRAHLVGRERLVRATESGVGSSGARTSMWLGGGVLAAAAAAAVVWFVWPTSPSIAVPNASIDGVATAPVIVDAGEWIQAPAKGMSALSVGRGAALALHDGARGRVAVLDEERVVVVLEEGRIAAEIDPKANRRVAVEAGPYRVAVVGTVFRVDWDPEDGDFAVAVTRGKVEVTAPASSSPIAVDAGHRLVVEGGTLSLIAIDGRPAPEPEAEPDVEIEPDVEPVTPVARAKPKTIKDAPEPATPTWRTLARDGKYEAAVAAVEATGFDAALASFSIADLEQLADAARLAGRVAKAESAYLALRKRFAGTPAAARAAFQLGRQATGSAAVKWLRAYLDEAPRGSFAKLARGRLIGALTDAGERRAATDAARVYLDSYPDGPHAKIARSLLESSDTP